MRRLADRWLVGSIPTRIILIISRCRNWQTTGDGPVMADAYDSVGSVQVRVLPERLLFDNLLECEASFFMDGVIVLAKMAGVVFAYVLFVALALRAVLWISGVGSPFNEKQTKRIFSDVLKELDSVNNADIEKWAVVTQARLEGADCRVASNYLRDVVKNTPREHLPEAIKAFFEGAVSGGRTY
mgnify:FL=1